MKNRFRKYLSQLTFLLIGCLVVGYIIFRLAFPLYYFSLYPYISFFFFLMGTATILIMMSTAKKEDRKYFNSFMIFKMVKLLVTILVFFLYFVFVKEQAISFTITFLAYYLIYTLYEIYFSTQLNKEIKNESAQKKRS